MLKGLDKEGDFEDEMEILGDLMDGEEIEVKAITIFSSFC
jgi:hypothetical protein